MALDFSPLDSLFKDETENNEDGMDDNTNIYSVSVSMTDKDKRAEFLKMAALWLSDNCNDDSWWSISTSQLEDDGQIDYDDE